MFGVRVIYRKIRYIYILTTTLLYFNLANLAKQDMTPTGKADEVCRVTAAQISDCGQVEFSLLYPVAASLRKLIKPLPDHHGRVTSKEPSASSFVLRDTKEES
jgi:hypothetical protein